MTVFAPAAASNMAICAPIPFDEPVTIATLLFSVVIIILSIIVDKYHHAYYGTLSDDF
jgi:Mg2+/Co2+ transporter CorB